MRRALVGMAAPLVLGLGTFTSCALLPRYPSAAPRKEIWAEEKLAKSMNPWFLGEGFSDRIDIEVDWVEGCRPGPHTIEGLRSIAVKYAPAGVPVDVTLDDEIPRAEWDATAKRAYERVDPLVRAHADFAHEPCDPEFETAHFYVLFAPGTDKWFFGYSTTWLSEDGASPPVDGTVVFQNPHERFAKLWLSLDRLEAMTLVHEFGHQLGLVANKTHERKSLGGHCTELTCLMAQPTLRVYARNAFGGMFNHFPSDYCVHCREDIRRAQEAWRERMAHGPDYRTQRVKDREIQYWSLSLFPLVEGGEYAAALEQIERARLRYPDDAGFAALEIRALTGLERFDEAAARLKTLSPEDRLDSSWSLGRALNLSGRYDETIALFDRQELHRMEEYEFEQTSFVLQDALVGSGRLDEAIALIDETLARGPAKYYRPERLREQRADLLCRAGRLDEALAAVDKGLGSSKTRHLWYDTGAEVYRALGRTADARALLEEWLALVRKPLLKAQVADPGAKWYGSWTIAGIQARLGDDAMARAAIAEAGEPPEGGSYDSILWIEVPVLARLGDWERAAERLRQRKTGSLFDVCGNRDLAPIQRDPRYADLFEKCANLPSTAK